ncbi:hypothetical protein GOBAR_AA00597 [Gossypium barbadense]|uniref:Major facilitator superfamily (MFS) profile domain-containing protein n=1 Tax=Gossypium barbadense TaxID=3634 RepID=A0A2P5YWK1_GOSBA|nr:hypothetical protein GOBAR_AA00597 [Gossypium barbadense]
MAKEINRLNDLEKPLITEEQNIVHKSDEYDSYKSSDENGSIFMVLLSTFVAVCGAFEFGTCVGYSAPTQAAIREDLGLSLAEAMRLSAVFCIAGWLAVYFSKKMLNWVFGMAPVCCRVMCHWILEAFLIGTVISWRELALAGLLPCIVLFVGLCFIPESPRWLAKVGDQKEFHAALRELRGKDADITEEAEEIQEYIETLQSLPKTTIWDLFQKQYIKSVIFGGINGVSFYASQTFALAGLSSAKAGTVAYACVQVSSAGTFLGCFLAGTSFYFKEHDLLPEWRPILAVAGVLIYVGSFSIGLGAAPWVIMSEIFPINVKGVAGSLVVLVNWLGAWAVSYTFNFMMTWSSYGTFYIYSGVSIITILFVVKFVPETKGKTLEEIQACINSHR